MNSLVNLLGGAYRLPNFQNARILEREVKTQGILDPI